MHNDELDRILAGQPELLPSPMFAAKVMHAVRREAAAPPPIPFPWKRALPGFAAAAAFIALAAKAAPAQIPQHTLDAWLDAAARAGAPWLFLAALLTLGSVGVARRLSSR